MLAWARRNAPSDKGSPMEPALRRRLGADEMASTERARHHAASRHYGNSHLPSGSGQAGPIASQDGYPKRARVLSLLGQNSACFQSAVLSASR
jgi:hypothetical protein